MITPEMVKALAPYAGPVATLAVGISSFAAGLATAYFQVWLEARRHQRESARERTISGVADLILRSRMQEITWSGVATCAQHEDLQGLRLGSKAVIEGALGTDSEAKLLLTLSDEGAAELEAAAEALDSQIAIAVRACGAVSDGGDQEQWAAAHDAASETVRAYSRFRSAVASIGRQELRELRA